MSAKRVAVEPLPPRSAATAAAAKMQQTAASGRGVRRRPPETPMGSSDDDSSSNSASSSRQRREVPRLMGSERLQRMKEAFASVEAPTSFAALLYIMKAQFEVHFWRLESLAERLELLGELDRHYSVVPESIQYNEVAVSEFVTETFALLHDAERHPRRVRYTRSVYAGRYINLETVSPLSVAVIMVLLNEFYSGPSRGGMFENLQAKTPQESARAWMQTLLSSHGSTGAFHFLNSDVIVPRFSSSSTNTFRARLVNQLQTRIAFNVPQAQLYALASRMQNTIQRWLVRKVDNKRPQEHAYIMRWYNAYTLAKQQLRTTLSSVRNAALAEQLANSLDDIDREFVGLFHGKAALLQYVNGQLQQTARAETSNHILVLGEPGTGKTSILRALIPIMVESGLIETPAFENYMVAGSTHFQKLSEERQRQLDAVEWQGAFEELMDIDYTSRDERRVAALITASRRRYDDEVIVYTPDRLIGTFEGGTEMLMETAVLSTLGSMFVLDEAYEFATRSESDRSAVLGQLNAQITQQRLAWGSALLGYERRVIGMLERANPGLLGRYLTRVNFYFYTPRELTAIFASLALLGGDALLDISERSDQTTLLNMASESDATLEKLVFAYMDTLYDTLIPITGRANVAELERNLFGSSNVRSARKLLENVLDDVRSRSGVPQRQLAVPQFTVRRLHTNDVRIAVDKLVRAGMRLNEFDIILPATSSPENNTNNNAVSAAQFSPSATTGSESSSGKAPKTSGLPTSTPTATTTSSLAVRDTAPLLQRQTHLLFQAF